MSTLLRRALGAGILALSLLPLHRLLAPADTGLAGEVTRRTAEASWRVGLWGTLATLGVAAVFAVLVPTDPAGWLRRVGRRLVAVSAARFALGVGLLGAAASAVVAAGVFHGMPTSVDEMVQLLHARALLAGGSTLPLPADPAAWMIQNSLMVSGGWTSVYPPMHTLLLAAGLAVGAPWLVGPLATGVMAGASTWSFERLLPGAPLAARTGGLLVALSPFVLFLGGTELSHATAGAVVALALLFGVRARDGHWGWSVAAGAAVGAAVADRPWTGLVLAGATLAALWIPVVLRDRSGARRPVRLAVGLICGGLPFAALLLSWNAHLFGSPFRLGYLSAFGPAHGLGWHADPWGNAYGLREALAYTGADVLQLGVRLFESPLPATALIGLALLVVPALPSGVAPLLAWACAGLLANAAYWHHGIHFGPRLLFETAPAWIGLWVLGARGLAGPGAPLPDRVRRGFGWAAVLSLAGGVALVPGTAAAYRGGSEAALPTPPRTPALLFVHGSWGSRLSGRLAAAGMRRDSVETALRRNDVCAVDRYVRWREEPEGAPPPLDFTPRSGSPSSLRARTLSPGNRVLVDPDARPDSSCLRQARADRDGTVELEPLLWQAPPLPGAPVVVARDLGPEANDAVRVAFPGYWSWAVVDGGPAGPRIEDYDAAMRTLWGSGEAEPSEARR